MILDATSVSASENLKFTYFELGRATARARILRENGFTACIGDFEHPICNFAADLNLNAERAERLAAMAIERSTFNVYSLPSDRPSTCARLLEAVGFECSLSMIQMLAPPQEDRSEDSQLRFASTPDERLAVARFMADQFFGHHPRKFRTRVSDATAACSALPLLSWGREGQILAAALVCEREGMLGIYNLCVEADARGCGIGSSMVRKLRSLSRHCCATLQCAPKLQGWYENLGFRSIGAVDVFALPRRRGFLL